MEKYIPLFMVLNCIIPAYFNVRGLYGNVDIYCAILSVTHVVIEMGAFAWAMLRGDDKLKQFMLRFFAFWTLSLIIPFLSMLTIVRSLAISGLEYIFQLWGIKGSSWGALTVFWPPVACAIVLLAKNRDKKPRASFEQCPKEVCSDHHESQASGEGTAPSL